MLTRPYEALSSGEQHQVDLLFVIGRSSIAIDEFTSALDRSLARRVAQGIGCGKPLRRALPTSSWRVVTRFLADVGFEWVYVGGRACAPRAFYHPLRCRDHDDAANVTISSR